MCRVTTANVPRSRFTLSELDDKKDKNRISGKYPEIAHFVRFLEVASDAVLPGDATDDIACFPLSRGQRAQIEIPGGDFWYSTHSFTIID